VQFEYEAVTGGNNGEEDPAATVLGLVTAEAPDLGGAPFIARSPILDGATMRICGKEIENVEIEALGDGRFELRGTVPAGCGSCDVVASLEGGTTIVAEGAFRYQSAEVIGIS